jgi:3',5'-cyclic AMP phosphodiesterase CpdA
VRLRKLVYILALILVLAATTANAIPAAAGASNVSAPFTFAVLGDSRPGDQNMATLRGIVRELNLLRPRFAVHTGDIIAGSGDTAVLENQFKGYESIVGKLDMPLYVAVGNHEIGSSKPSETVIKRLLKRDRFYYSLSYGNSYFAILDSEIPGQSGKITGEQLRWLEQDLEKNKAAAHKFVFVHRPFFPVDGHIGSSLDQYPQDRAKVTALLKKYRIDAVFSGHEHLYNKSVVNGITEYITGGAGAPLYPSLKGTPLFHHYLLVTVDGARVTVAVIRPGSIMNSDLTDYKAAK